MSNVIESHKTYNARLRLFYGVVALLILTLITGLAYRQLFLSHVYSDRESIQNLRRILIPGPRGNILDRNENLLVGNRPRFAAVVYLAELRQEFRREYIEIVRDYRQQQRSTQNQRLDIKARAAVVQSYIDVINSVLGREISVDPLVLERHFTQRLLLPFTLINDLEPEEYARLIEQIPIESPIQIHSSSVRHYPYGAAAAHTLGYVVSTIEIPREGVPGENLMTFNIRGSEGKAGIELTFDETLRGRTGGEILVVDPSGFRYGEPVKREKPLQGSDIVTSLDIRLQETAERAIGDRYGAAVAIDPRTGEILALASRPAYNLNDFSPSLSSPVAAVIQDQGAWLNRATQGLYPPGSTFKLITAIAGLEDGVFSPESTSYCTGHYRVAGRLFPCHNRNGHGEVDLREAIRVSCNVFFYQYGVRTGIRSISREARNFQLDQPTGLEVAEASRMLIGDPEWKRRVHSEGWFPGDTANISIGQGFLRVTPLQMAAFTAALASQKHRVHPTILRSSEHVQGAMARDPAQAMPLRPEHYAAVIEGMEQAVQSGTGRLAGVQGLRVAGKTGTAQVRSGGSTLHMAWFIAFAPIENPEIAIAVLIEGTAPNDGYGGGITAGPIVRSLLQQYFSDRDESGIARR